MNGYNSGHTLQIEVYALNFTNQLFYLQFLFARLLSFEDIFELFLCFRVPLGQQGKQCHYNGRESFLQTYGGTSADKQQQGLYHTLQPIFSAVPRYHEWLFCLHICSKNEATFTVVFIQPRKGFFSKRIWYINSPEFAAF